MQYNEMSKEQLLQLKAELDERYKEAKAKGLNLNMSRGKPSATQLNVTMDMLDVINSSSDLKSEDGTDCRNYGVLDGIPEAKKLMADMMGTTPEHVIIYGNASLNIMYDQVSRAYTPCKCVCRKCYLVYISHSLTLSSAGVPAIPSSTLSTSFPLLQNGRSNM